jgi:hypothetical protein
MSAVWEQIFKNRRKGQMVKRKQTRVASGWLVEVEAFQFGL